MKELLKARWKVILKPQFAAFLLGCLAFIVLVIKSEPGFVLILDYANLLFHEAGHPFYGLFYPPLTVYGGTMGQLTFPVILAISFWRQQEPISVAVSIVWFFENGLNIARYVADARLQVLPLVGGGCHDWATILGRWNMMAYDTRIAGVIRVVSCVGMILPVLWIVWLWFAPRKERVAEMQKEVEKVFHFPESFTTAPNQPFKKISKL